MKRHLTSPEDRTLALCGGFYPPGRMTTDPDTANCASCLKDICPEDEWLDYCKVRKIGNVKGVTFARAGTNYGAASSAARYTPTLHGAKR